MVCHNWRTDPKYKIQLALGEFLVRQDGDTLPGIDEFTSRFGDIGDSLRSKLTQAASATHAFNSTVLDLGPISF